MNKMTYEQALVKLKGLEKLQINQKKRVRSLKAFYIRDWVYEIEMNKLNNSINKRKKEINYLLSIIHAHKQARKLYAEVQFYKQQYGG